MIRTIYFPPVGSPQIGLPLSAARSALADADGLLWVSLDNPSEEETLQILDRLFHFHPLTIEDCLSSGYQTPKVDDYGEYIFIIALALGDGNNPDGIQTHELDIFLGSNYVVSFHTAARMLPVEKLWQRLERDERLYNNGSDFLCHALLDNLVDEYLPTLDIMEDEIDRLENIVLANPHPGTLERILQLKHQTVALRRIVAPQREMLNRLCRDDYPMIDRQSRLYFRDIYDHLVRIYDMIDVIRDMSTSTLEVYLNATSLRLNEVMKALTVVATIFLPLTFLAGVYGMNFHYMPELTWRWGYFIVWGLFALIAAGMLIYFKKKKWF